MREDLIYGFHVIQCLLDSKPEKILTLYLADERDDNRVVALILRAEQEGIVIHRVNKKRLNDWFPSENHQGIVANIRPAALLSLADLDTLLDELSAPPLLLILDGVQDPHNLGAILRSADASGVTAVIIPKDRAVALTATVRKIASGAAELVPVVQATNLARCLEHLKQRGIWIVGTEMDAKKTLFETDLKGPIAIVLGAEGSGLRRLTETQCDFLMKIPMKGSVESLNVSVSAGICLFEALRQRMT
jgi:23S rRNA (guanosine2251-2'-O)-methyltransferase